MLINAIYNTCVFAKIILTIITKLFSWISIHTIVALCNLISLKDWNKSVFLNAVILCYFV